VGTHRPALTSRAVPLLALAAAGAFAAVFVAWPFAAIVERGLTQGGSLDLPFDVWFSRETLGIAWFTLWQALASTALTVVLGLPLAWALGRLAFRGRSLVRGLLLVPFVLPTIVVASAFVALLPAALESGVPAILAAHVYFNLAVVVRVVGGSWASLDPALAETAATLGAGPWRRARAITLPALGPALSSAAALTFLFCFTSFGIVLVLGGPTRSTLETEIYAQAARSFDLRAAAALSLLQLAAIAAMLAVASRLERRTTGARTHAEEVRALHRPRGWERVSLAATLAAAGVAVGAPLALLGARSLATPQGLGLDHFRALGRETPALLVAPWHALVNSLLFAGVATAIALLVGGAAALGLATLRPGAADVVALLPLGVSAVMLGFGMLIAFDAPPLDIRRAWWLVPVAQSLVATSFVVRVLVPSLRSIPPELREAAAVLGAPPWRVRREIELPLVAGALGVAAGFAFAIALGEFGATLFLARSDAPTLPVAIFRFLGRPGAENQGLAAALAVCLGLLTLVAALLVERAAGDRRGAL
jgi:thiamine transport system permease protein